MKNFTVNAFIFLAGIFLLPNCIGNRFLLQGEPEDVEFLSNYIKNLSKEKKVLKRPLIVIDGKPFRYNYELAKNSLPIKRTDIYDIIILSLDKSVEIYGEFGNQGALLIETENYHFKEGNKSGKIKERKVKFFFDGKPVSRFEFKQIKDEEIEDISIKTGQDALKIFPGEDLDGVLYVTLKKKDN